MGTIVLKSTYEGKQEVDFSEIVVNEITLVGSRCGPFKPALRLLDTGVINPESLIVERFSIKDGLKAFEKAAQPGVLKILIDPDI
jgi:threonine dehydrogenase-like Zn-dependent dehydrogenase